MKLAKDPQQAVAQLRDYLTTADLSRCQRKYIASKFCVHESILRRKLNAMNLTWQDLKDAERAKRMDRLIREGRASRVNCLAALGYTGESSLRRFFIKHTGHSMDRFYRQRRAA